MDVRTARNIHPVPDETDEAMGESEGASEIVLEAGPRGARLKGSLLFVLILACGVLLLEFVVLQGDRVAHGVAYLNRDEPARIVIQQIGVVHLVEIRSSRATPEQSPEQALRYRLVDPDGGTVTEHVEIVAHKQRFFEFTPKLEGEYKLHIEDSAVLLGASRGLARVSVWVDDRRFLRPMLSAIPFSL